MEDENVIYERIYLPVFTYPHKQEVAGYEFIETVKSGIKRGHILKGADGYYLCVRHDDKISFYPRLQIPMGYRRNDLEGIKKLLEKFDRAYNREMQSNYAQTVRSMPNVVTPPKLNVRLPWEEKMKGCYLINTTTGREVALYLPREKVLEETSLNKNLLETILYEGCVVKRWCLKAPRTDGKSWPDFIAEKRAHNGICKPTVLEVTFSKPDVQPFRFTTLRETSKVLGVSHEKLRLSLAGGVEFINGYKVEYPEA
jgi:hypothetical protein